MVLKAYYILCLVHWKLHSLRFQFSSMAEQVTKPLSKALREEKELNESQEQPKFTNKHFFTHANLLLHFFSHEHLTSSLVWKRGEGSVW